VYRILFINWRDIKNPEAGGAEVHLHEIAGRIAAKGHDVTVLASTFRDASPEEMIGGVKVVRRGGKFTFNFHVPGAIRSLSRDKPFDIVVDDVNKIPFYTPLYVKPPLLALAHHLFAKTIFLEAPFPVALYVYAGEALIPAVYRHTRLIVVSESTRRELAEKGIPEANIDIVYNAVDHTRFKPAQDPKPSEPVIGYVGRIKRYKKIDYLLESMNIVLERLPQARLMLAGSGDYLPALVALAARLGISDRVEFMGFVSEEEKIAMLQRAHVVVNPSSKEGWGVTVIEANACGTPVIASDVPGLRDAVVDGETGYLVPFGDVEACARRTLEVLQDDVLRRRLSEAAIAHAKTFNWDDSAEAVLRIIEQVIQGCKEV
jgi:glycosyltransferase involved in cell wall biosynthesis